MIYAAEHYLVISFRCSGHDEAERERRRYQIPCQPQSRSHNHCAIHTFYVLISSLQPIPLELLTVLSFDEPPQQRGNSLLFRGLRDRDRSKTDSDAASVMGDRPEVVDSRLVYPCSVHHAGRVGGHYHLFAESASARAEWERKLGEAKFLRDAVQEANKVRHSAIQSRFPSHCRYRCLSKPRSVSIRSLPFRSRKQIWAPVGAMSVGRLRALSLCVSLPLHPFASFATEPLHHYSEHQWASVSCCGLRARCMDRCATRNQL